VLEALKEKNSAAPPENTIGNTDVLLLGFTGNRWSRWDLNENGDNDVEPSS
jgi:hypothetical protein